ncbi:MAG TPA: hypothetical protein PLK68_14405, partial [Thomasclavelia ramosa]|nr:hypothetical protein [Thomasclavelia ramosa]
SNNFSSLGNIIYLQNKFILSELYRDFPHYKTIIGSNGNEKRLTTPIFDQLDLFKENAIYDDSLCILGLIKNNRFYRYIPSKYIEQNENLNMYKVIIPKSNGTGALGETLSSPLIGKPLIGYTQSFIGIGAFDNYDEAKAAKKYIETKFARAMLGILKVTQDNNRDVWEYVPLQDFTKKSDIDWNQTINEIDRQLYAKYNLTNDEIAFIESMIKPME